MIGWILRGFGGLIALFTLILGAIVGQPRDDAAMHAFFAPPGCDAPCFMGIRPGVTTEAEAVTLLRAQPWIGKVNLNANGIAWTWSGTQPAFVSQRRPDEFTAHLKLRSGVVAAIYVSTSTRWGEFLYLFGLPDREVFMTGQSLSNPYLIHDAAYWDHGFEVETQTHCPLDRPDATWYSQVLITWPAPGPVVYGRMRLSGKC